MVIMIFATENFRKGYLTCNSFIWEFSLDPGFPKVLETDISGTILVPQVLRPFM